MKRVVMALAVSLAFCLIATSTISAGGQPYVEHPLPMGYPATFQQKMQAAHHWDVLAADITQQVSRALGRPEVGSGKPVFVNPKEKTFFSEAFATLLTSQLMRKGVVISGQETGSVKIEYGVEVIKHRAVRRVKGTIPFVDRELPHHEVVITTTVLDQKTVLARRSDIFYANDEDIWHYRKKPEPRAFQVVQ